MRWLFHIAPLADWSADAEPFTPASLAREGFVHASWRDDVLESARLHVPVGRDHVVLQIDPRRLPETAALNIVETPRGPMPHLGGAVPRDAVRAVWSLADFTGKLGELPDEVRGTRFGFLAFTGMTLLDLVGVLDPISRLEWMGVDPASTCTTVALDETMVWSGAGAGLRVERVRGDLADFDVLIVPGGPGTRARAEDAGLAEWLATFPANRILASVCSGALLLGAAGRLHGRRATTHAGVMDRLAAYGAVPTQERVVDEGTVITAGGVTSALDLGIHLVRRLYGDAAAERIATQMEMR